MNYTDSTLLIVGDVPQYFFDNLVIAQAQDVTKTVHRQPDPLVAPAVHPRPGPAGGQSGR
jgi:hypothetical protein